MNTYINLSDQILLVSTNNKLALFDPMTSSLLQTYQPTTAPLTYPILAVTNPKIGFVLTCQSDKNHAICYSYKGAELWKQHLAGQFPIIHLIEYHGIIIAFQKNKEVRIWKQISEHKLNLQIDASQINLVRNRNHFIAVSDTISNDILIFLIDDILSLQELAKPIKTLKGHRAQVVDICIGDSLFIYSVSKDKQLLVWTLDSESIIFSFNLDAEPKCIEIDTSEEFIFVGCTNNEIYQIRGHTKSIHYNYDYGAVEKDLEKKKTLSGHQQQITALKFFTDNNKCYLISGSADGQILFWSLFSQSQASIIKKITSFSNKEISSIQTFGRPQEFKYQTEEEMFFKYKRGVNLNPLRKGQNEDNKKEHLMMAIQRKQIRKQMKGQLKEYRLKEKVEESIEQLGSNEYESHIRTLEEENKKLKIMNQKLFNQCYI